LALKASFAVEEEGFDEDVDDANEENRLLAFINYIKVKNFLHWDAQEIH
jgi:hypothetical protein